MFRYYLREYLPFRERGYFYLDCFLPLVLVRVLFALCLGLGMWNIFEDFDNSYGEICVDNYSLSIIWFSRFEIIDGNFMDPF